MASQYVKVGDVTTTHKFIGEQLGIDRYQVAAIERQALQKFRVRLQARLGQEHPSVDPEKLLRDFADAWIV